VAVRKIQYLGREVVGQDIPFRIVQDGSVVLEVDDGAKIRIRTIVLSVLKTNEKGEDGERLYIVQSAQQITLDTPATEDQQ
jgi:hypothetical protein